MYQRTQVHSRELRFGLTGLCVVLFVTAHANSATLPGPSTSVQCHAAGNSSFHSTECTQGGGDQGTAFAIAFPEPTPLASVEVTAPAAAFLGSGASATVLYYFQVTGGNLGDVVPIMVDFRLSVFSTPESSAIARLIYYTTAMGAVLPRGEELVCNSQICDETELSDTLSLQALSGATLNSITLYAEAQAPASRISNESARALADPYIYIDPAFPNASLYSIVVSPGVGNVPLGEVPEPATLGLVGTVLLALGLLRRKHP